MITLVLILLALTAAYCGGMWLYVAYLSFTREVSEDMQRFIELHTFHLGLCFVLALGAIGMILKGGS